MSTKSDVYWGADDHIRIYTETSEYIQHTWRHDYKQYLLIEPNYYSLDIVKGDILIKLKSKDIPKIRVFVDDVIEFEIDEDGLLISYPDQSLTGKAFHEQIWNWEMESLKIIPKKD